MGVWNTMKAVITNALTNLLDFLLWIFWGEASALQSGQSKESPLEIQAVPGLTTLLDISLFRSVEAELTGTLHTSHTLLQAWLDVQSQSRRVLQFLKRHSGTNNNVPLESSSFRTQLEFFARACHDGACDVLERMSTDRFAQTANLSDPFDGNNMALNNLSFGNEGRTAGNNFEGGSTNHSNNGSSSQQDFILSALQESSWDTGRRRLPTQQRPRDCWESARLHCPDYVWGDEVVGLCQKTVRHLAKHPFCSVAFAERHALSDGPSSGPDASLQQNYMANRITSLSYLTNTLEREEATLLLQLVLVDVTCRLSQFKAALEAESVVSKRLYLVKSEYRAPLRAFWEAHSSVQRAPSIELVQESLQRISSSSKDRRNKSIVQETASAGAKTRLQRFLDSSELVELLALERQIEQYELDMALSLFPFCELARYLDQKKAVPRNGDANVLDLLSRLKNVLVAGTSIRQRNTDHPTSAGIRPLLLDFQGVPRDDDEDEAQHLSSALSYLRSSETLARIDARLDDFVDQVKFLARLCSQKESKNAFYSEKKADIDPPSASHCRKFDGKLFKCLFKDWYTMVVKQHELTTEAVEANDESLQEKGSKMEVLAEEIRRAEMAVSMSMVSTESALKKVKDRVQMISSDRTKRFDILKEILEDLCLREMNLHVHLVAPLVEEVLELRSTDNAIIPALYGVFGIPLLQAKQVLPLG
ncbi:hypothetical protein ACA910_007356 [Epithemia clementina (nom. ined.)]